MFQNTPKNFCKYEIKKYDDTCLIKKLKIKKNYNNISKVMCQKVITSKYLIDTLKCKQKWRILWWKNKILYS